MQDRLSIPSFKKNKLTSEESILELSGYLGRRKSSELHDLLDEVESLTPKKVIIECSQLIHIDSSILGILLGYHQKLESQGRTLFLRWVPESILRVLEISRLDSLLHIERDRRSSRPKTVVEDDSVDSHLGDLKRCWDLYGCNEKTCLHFNQQTYICWLTPHVPCKPVIHPDLNRELLGCVQCEVFKNNINQYGNIQVDYLHYIAEAEAAYLRLMEAKVSIEGNYRVLEDYAGSLFNKATDAILVFDGSTGQILSCNPQAKKMLQIQDGYTQNYFDFCIELRTPPRPWDDPLLTEDSPQRRWDQTWSTPNIPPHIMEVTYSSLSIPYPGCILAIARDVTLQRQQEQESQLLQNRIKRLYSQLSALEDKTKQFNSVLERDRLSQSFLDAIMELAPRAQAGILLLRDQQSNTLIVSAISGYRTGAQLIGKRISPGETIPGLAIHDLWAGEMNTPFEIPWENQSILEGLGTKATLTIPLQTHESQLGVLILQSFDNKEAFVGLDMKLIEAISQAAATSLDRAFLIERIRSMQMRTRSIMNTIPMPVFSLDPSGRVDAWNSYAEDLFGWSFNEAVGKNFTVFYPSQIEAGRHPFFQKVMAGQEWSGDIPILTKKGEKIPTHQTVKKFSFSGFESEGLLVLVKDLREEIEFAKHLQRTQKMESVGILSGGIAHDLNNYLSGIMGYAGFMRMETPKESPLSRYAQVIETTTAKASHLTRKLLAFARETPDEKVVTDLNCLVEDASHLLKPSLGAKITFNYNPSPTPLEVEIAPSTFQQALLNLCLNAVDAMPEGGILGLSTYTCSELKDVVINHSHGTDSEWVVLEVSDSGCGISPELIEKIFSPFFTTKPAGKGTGLGLLMVEKAVQTHHGCLGLTSEINKGTTFKLYLPQYSKPARIVVEEKANLLPEMPLVLFVDDEPLVRELGKAALGNAGMEIKTAENGAEALTFFQKHPEKFHIAVIDIVMPVMDGEELIQHLHSLRPDLPILVSSGYSPKGRIQEAISEGKFGFLPKPYLRKQLIDSIQALLAQHYS